MQVVGMLQKTRYTFAPSPSSNVGNPISQVVPMPIDIHTILNVRFQDMVIGDARVVILAYLDILATLPL